jgi:hypothetical protein
VTEQTEGVVSFLAAGAAGRAAAPSGQQHRRRFFELAASFARANALYRVSSSRPEQVVARAAANVALALQPFARQREWLANPFPTLARVAVGVIPISNEAHVLAAASSSAVHAIDGPEACPMDIAIAAALTARTDAEVSVAAGLALYLLAAMGETGRADLLAHSLLAVDRWEVTRGGDRRPRSRPPRCIEAGHETRPPKVSRDS